jgi:hypothetical protein
MRRSMKVPTRLALAVVALAVLAGACSSDSSDVTSSSTTAAAGSGTTSTTAANGAETVQFDKTIQGELAAVGCYQGGIDGIVGPATDAAILAFQKAAGLHADGELGPETEKALSEAAAKNQQVCTSSGTTTAPTSSTTTTTQAGNPPPCTAAALAKALPAGDTLQSYACADDYAGVYVMQADRSEARAILKAEGSAWTNLGQEPCGGASAGIAPAVLAIGCNAS